MQFLGMNFLELFENFCINLLEKKPRFTNKK